MITVKMLNHKSNNVFDITGRHDGQQFFKDVSKDGQIMDPVEIFKGYLPEVEKTEEDSDDGPVSLKMTLSDATLDRDEERILVNGWDVDQYKRNPVVLWGHDRSRPAIGTMTELSFGDDLKGTILFSEKRVDHFAWSIGQKLISGILKAGSVGFSPKEWKFIDDPDDPAWLEFIKQELLEFSIVNVPANPNALVEDSVAFYPYKQMESLAEKLQELTDLMKGDHNKSTMIDTTSIGVSIESLAKAVTSAVKRDAVQ